MSEVLLAAATPMDWKPPGKNTADVLSQSLKLVAASCSGTAPSKLANPRSSHFYNLEMQCPDSKTKICLHSAVSIVKGTKKSTWSLVDPQDQDGACKVSTEARISSVLYNGVETVEIFCSSAACVLIRRQVADLMEDGENRYMLHGFCKGADLLSYKFDKQAAVVRILSCAEDGFVISDVKVVPEASAANIVASFGVWSSILMAAEERDPKRPAELLENLTPSPNNAKRVCRQLNRNLTDA